MGEYESAFWQSDGTGMNRRERQGGTYHPYKPDFLAGTDFALYPETAAAVSSAEHAVQQLNEQARYLTNTEPLARLILRSEAMASSRIEGLSVNAQKLLEFEALDEMGIEHYLDSTEASVLGNIAAMQQGVSDILPHERISVEGICHIHELLLENTPDAHLGGILRSEQNWIGGNRMNPIGARYVPPRPEYVHELLDDLITFCNKTPYSPLATAAIVHAQFETIHPFADGNGRTGRTLVHAILKRSQLVKSTVPPISLLLATDKQRYIDNLAAFRTQGNDPQERMDRLNDWVEYFAHITELACERAFGFEETIANLQDEWMKAVAPRSGSAAEMLMKELPKCPVFSVSMAAKSLNRSIPAARNAIKTLVEKGILVQNSRNKKSSIYVAQGVMNAFTSYERALASIDGDTSISKPTRPVPQRVKG